MGRIIAIANQKGGVGKTTTAVNLSACMGVLEKKVLLIDADPQSNATSGLGFDVEKIKVGTYELLENIAKAEDVILETNFPNLSLIPAHLNLVAAEIELVDNTDREHMLANALKSVKAKFDYIFIDCPPSLGLITINSLTAADSVVIPVQSEYYALEGLGKLLNTIKSIQNLHNPDLGLEGLLLTMFDKRLRLSNQVAEEVKTHFASAIFKTIIHRNVRLSEAPSHGEPIINYDADSSGARQYLSLAQELIERNNK